jgi:threonine aldolase
MMKAHCDNCDSVIVDADPARLVNAVLGFQCRVVVTITKNTAPCDLCAVCLLSAVLAFADSVRGAVPALPR